MPIHQCFSALPCYQRGVCVRGTPFTYNNRVRSSFEECRYRVLRCYQNMVWKRMVEQNRNFVILPKYECLQRAEFHNFHVITYFHKDSTVYEQSSQKFFIFVSSPHESDSKSVYTLKYSLSTDKKSINQSCSYFSRSWLVYFIPRQLGCALLREREVLTRLLFDIGAGLHIHGKKPRIPPRRRLCSVTAKTRHQQPMIAASKTFRQHDQ